MDQQAFHRLATVIATATSRRAAIRDALAILVGGAALATTTGASAATCRKGRQTCSRNAQCCSGSCQTGRGIPTRDRNRCTCEAGTTLCGNTCVDTETDKRHCGACGNACNAGDTCIAGTCRIRQQCYSRDGGLCYMTWDGQEIRADGLYSLNVFPTLPFECVVTDDCAGTYRACDQAGVHCECIRAMDLGNGYEEILDPGQGRCYPMLDNGDGATLCNPDDGTTACAYTAAADERLMCIDSVAFEGTCNGSSCTGVGACDDSEVECACTIAWMFIEIVGSPGAYIDFNPFEGVVMEPACVSYVSPVGGVCTPPV